MLVLTRPNDLAFICIMALFHYRQSLLIVTPENDLFSPFVPLRDSEKQEIRLAKFVFVDSQLLT